MISNTYYAKTVSKTNTLNNKAKVMRMIGAMQSVKSRIPGNTMSCRIGYISNVKMPNSARYIPNSALSLYTQKRGAELGVFTVQRGGYIRVCSCKLYAYRFYFVLIYPILCDFVLSGIVAKRAFFFCKSIRNQKRKKTYSNLHTYLHPQRHTVPPEFCKSSGSVQ